MPVAGATTRSALIAAWTRPARAAAPANGAAVAASLGSLAALLSILIGAIAAWYFVPAPVALVINLLVPLVWARHHANIRRLLKGTEPKIGQRSSSAAA